MRVLLCFYVAVCLVVLVMADTGRLPAWMNGLASVPLGDKLMHSMAAGMLAFLTNLAMLRYWPGGRWQALAYGAAAVVLVCTLEEASNLLTPYRACELGDLVANYLGILLTGVLPFALHHALVDERVAA